MLLLAVPLVYRCRCHCRCHCRLSLPHCRCYRCRCRCRCRWHRCRFTAVTTTPFIATTAVVGAGSAGVTAVGVAAETATPAVRAPEDPIAPRAPNTAQRTKWAEIHTLQYYWGRNDCTHTRSWARPVTGCKPIMWSRRMACAGETAAPTPGACVRHVGTAASSARKAIQRGHPDRIAPCPWPCPRPGVCVCTCRAVLTLIMLQPADVRKAGRSVNRPVPQRHHMAPHCTAVLIKRRPHMDPRGSTWLSRLVHAQF
jgi:hypothetical protein